MKFYNEDMTDPSTIVLMALYTQRGKCLDYNDWEFIGVAKAVCDAMSIKYPKVWNTFCLSPEEMTDAQLQAYELMGGDWR